MRTQDMGRWGRPRKASPVDEKLLAQRAAAAEKLLAQRDAAAENCRIQLRKLVRLAETSQRELERRNGWNQGYLSQVLNGSIHLNMQHLVGVLKGLGISLERFFEHLERR